MPSLDQDAYLKQRVDGQLQWLSRASKTNKRQFLAWRILEILLGTSITILSPLSRSLPWAPLTIAVAGGGIAVSGALLALSRSQENWVRYRSLAEGLKREKYLFLTATPPYDSGEDAYGRFVLAAEDLMTEERGGWARLQAGEDELPGEAGALVLEPLEVDRFAVCRRLDCAPIRPEQAPWV